ncbi:MAG TPA: efflux transporter outer membrane subunit [Luteimonas sp.]|nr:efflux transporter outer membrane subunit [Luteimonas sp.]
MRCESGPLRLTGGIGAGALLWVVLGGCVSTPMPDLQVPLPSQWLHTIAASAAPRPGSPWWRNLGDSQLDALIERALAENLDIGQATARLRAARELGRTADSELRPDLHFRTSNPIDPDASASYLVAGFDSVWELGLFGRGKAVHRMARAQLDIASADVGDAKVSVAAEVARQWILMRAAQQRLVVLEQISERRALQAQLMAERRRLMLASPQDAAQADAAAAQARMAATDPREAEATSAQALALLLGQAEPDPAWRQPGALPHLNAPPFVSIPADLLRQRPDIRRAQAAVLNAAGELGEAKADRFPSVAIGGSVVRSTSEAERISTDTGSIGSLGPLIDIPLFDWGLRRAKAMAKGELLTASVVAYRKSVMVAVSEVESGLVAMEEDQSRETQANLALRALDDAASDVETRKRLGLASGLDVAGSKVERDQASIELDNAIAHEALDYVALCKALGGDSGGVAVAPAQKEAAGW